MQHCVARRTNGKRNMQLEMGQARMRRVASRRAASHCNFVLFASTSFNFVFFSAYFSFTLLFFSAYLFLSLFPFLSPVHRFAVTVSLHCLSFCSSFTPTSFATLISSTRTSICFGSSFPLHHSLRFAFGFVFGLFRLLPCVTDTVDNKFSANSMRYPLYHAAKH